MNVWGQPSKGRSNGSSAVSAEVTSGLDIFLVEEVARHTRELLATPGWCLWECSALGGEVIVVVLDEKVEGMPGGYPVYTAAELEELFQGDVSEATLRLVHEAKKLGDAVVISVEDRGGL